MKQFKHKTLRSYIGAKCRQEGGKSEAKIHDALQIANLIADDLFDGDTLSIQTRLAWSKFKPTNIFGLFMKNGARRYLQRMKKGRRSD